MAQAGISFTGPIMPFELLKKQRISLGAKNVFALIAAFRRRKRRCFAQTKWFAEQLGVSESSARNYIKSLIEVGLIKRDGNGCYHVIWEALGIHEADVICDEKDKFCAGDRKICGIYNNLNTKSENNPSPSPTSAVSPAPVARDASSFRDAEEKTKEAFAQVWAAYPRPPRFVSREKAWKEFRRQWKQGTLPKLEVILSAIGLNREQNPAWSPSNEGGRYIPNLETWLAGRRWSDDFAGEPITSPGPSAEEIALAEQVAAIQKHTEEWGNASSEQIQEFHALEKRFGLQDGKRSMAFGLFRFLAARGVPLPRHGGGDLLTLLKNAARHSGREG